MDVYIQDSQKGGIEAGFSILHNTLGRPITMFKNGKEIIIATNPKHNFIWESSPTNDEIQIIPVSGVFKARIMYGREQTKGFFNTAVQGKGSDQPGVTLNEGDVRIKVDSTGAAFLSEATRVVFDGKVFHISTDDRPHGIFNNQFYDFTLTRLP